MTQNTNSMDEIISIIVPIYNAEKFLASCIDSILSQTFKNFELFPSGVERDFERHVLSTLENFL